MKSWFSYFKEALKRQFPKDPISKEKSISGFKKNLHNLHPFFLKHWRKGLIGAVIILSATLINFPIPLITRFLIDKVILNKQLQFLIITIVIMAGIKLTAKLLSTFQSFYFARFEQTVILDVQDKLLSHTLRAPKAFFDSKETGYLMSRLLSDVQGLRWFFSSTLVNIVASIIQLLGGIVFLFYLKWQLALVVVLILPALVILINFFARKIRILSHHSMEQNANISRAMEESLSTTSLIKAFSSEKRTAKKIMNQLRQAFHIGMEQRTVSALANLTVGIFPDVARLLVLLAGAYWIITDQWSLGSLLAFQSYMGYVYGPAHFLATANIQLQGALASLERVSALFDIVPEENLDQGQVAEKLRGEVEFKDVTFSYDGKEMVLEEISFKVKPGEWIAVVGPSGVGKTTLISLLLSFYKPQEGEIYYDDLPLSAYNLSSLRKRIGYLSQNPYILSGTIIDNLKYGSKDATDREVIKMAKIAGIHDFISHLPHQYREKLGEKGINLSAGQRQRLALARALIKDPDIYILDEPTSALDHIVEGTIFKSLPALIKKKTLFVVTHRLSTVNHTSRVLLLNEKRLLAVGSHQQLLASNDYYNSLLLTQTKAQAAKILMKK